MTDLFDPVTHARTDDPATSKEAAQKVAVAALTHMDRILASLIHDGPGTFQQIAIRTGLTDAQVWRRLPDLQKRGLAFPTEQIAYGRRVWQATPPTTNEGASNGS